MYVCQESVIKCLEKTLTHHCVLCICGCRHSVLNCPCNKGILQHKWRLQKEEWSWFVTVNYGLWDPADIDRNPAPYLLDVNSWKDLVFLSSIFLLSMIGVINLLVKKLWAVDGKRPWFTWLDTEDVLSHRAKSSEVGQVGSASYHLKSSWP